MYFCIIVYRKALSNSTTTRGESPSNEIYLRAYKCKKICIMIDQKALTKKNGWWLSYMRGSGSAAQSRHYHRQHYLPSVSVVWTTEFAAFHFVKCMEHTGPSFSLPHTHTWLLPVVVDPNANKAVLASQKYLKISL